MSTEVLPVVYGTNSWSVNQITGNPLYPKVWNVLVSVDGSFVVGKGFDSEADALAFTEFTSGFLPSFTGSSIKRGPTYSDDKIYTNTNKFDVTLTKGDSDAGFF